MVAFLLALAGFFAISLFFANGPVINPTPTSTAAATATPTPTPTAAPSPTPTPTLKDLGQGTFDSGMRENVASILDSQNTAVLDQGGTFSNPISVVVANSAGAVNLTPFEAVKAMDSMFTPMDPNPWDTALSTSVLESYRNGPYGDYFPDGAIVAKSHDGHVFSFIGDGASITTMFMAASDGLVQ